MNSASNLRPQDGTEHYREARASTLRSPRKYPVLGVAEVAELLSLERSTISAYLTRGQMPAPWVTLACGPLWKRDQIKTWRPEAFEPGHG